MPRALRAAVYLIAAGLVIVGIAATIAATRLQTDNSIERWLDPDSPATLDYERFLETFGADEFVVVALSGKPLFEPAALDAMLMAQEAIERVPAVTRVSGIPSVYRDLFGAEDPEALRDEFTSTPFYHGLFISSDERAAGLFVEIDPPHDAEGRRQLVESIERGVAPLKQYGFRVDLVGPPTLNVALDQISEREGRRALPIALVCSVVVLLFLLRSLRGAAVALVCAWLSVAMPMGLIEIADYRMNMVSTALPPLLWVLSLSHSVHLVTRYHHYRHEGGSLRDATWTALRDVGLPCTLAAVTTAAGFLSFLFADMPPVRQMGVFASIGVVLSLIANLAVGPVVIILLRVPARRHIRSAWLPVLTRAESIAERHPRAVLFAFASLIAAGAVSISRIHPEPNPLSFLPKNAPAVVSYNFVSERLTGLYTVEVVAECPRGWLDPEYWGPLDRLAGAIQAMPSVARVVTPLDFLKKLNQWDHGFDPTAYRLPESRGDAERLLAQMPESIRPEIDRLVSSDGSNVRLSILVRVMDARRFYALANEVNSELLTLPSSVRGHLTGIVLLLNNAQVNLALTQVKSFAFAFCIVFLLIAGGLRSLRLMLMSILPNVAPILTVFALMPLIGIPLDAATVLVAGVALGIAVDDTIHLIASYRRARATGASLSGSIRGALATSGPAIIYTTITSCIGFFTLCTSGFVPIRYFGLLSGVALATALVANLLLTPATLFMLDRNGDRSGVGGALRM